MDTIISFATTVFWGVVLLSALVFMHEGGHFLAARLCGVRVTEYFLGLPCRYNLSHTSRRIGTKFGITPLLLGGYAMICGMDTTSSDHAAAVLSLIHRRGTVTVGAIARELGITEDEALDACIQLLDWGSIAPIYDASKGEYPQGSTYPSTYAAMPRDARGATIYDGRFFDRAHATEQGAAWEPPVDEDAFLELERSRTYGGKGFFARALMLVAGILVNVVSGILLLMCIYSVVGIEVSQNVNMVGGIEEGSVAESIGLEPGDTIVSIDGIETDSWTAVVEAIQNAAGTGSTELVYERDGVTYSAQFELQDDEILGIEVPTEVVRLNPIDSARLSISYVVQTAQSIIQLFIPQHTVEMLESSTSIVGISVMSAQAAAAGPATFLMLAALVSFSLGLMNLLPIPPLDGGKLLIEIIQAVTKRQVPRAVQNGLSYAGVILFLAVFVFVLRNDIVRFIL